MSVDTSLRQSPAADRERHWHPIDLVALVWRQRRLTFGTVFIVVAAAITAVLVVTPEYTAQASFMPPPEESGNISALLRDPLHAFTRASGSAALDRLLGFLDSETARTIMVRRHDLRAHYRVRSEWEAARAFERAANVAASPEAVITVAVTDRDPRLAARMANDLVAVTDSLYRESETLHAGQMRRFLEVRVEENRRALAGAEDAARQFALRFGVISLPDQVTTLVEQMADVEGRIRALDVKIGAAQQILGPSHSSVREMEIERAQLAAQKRRLMDSTGRPSSDPLLSFRDVPDRALEYARLERDIKIQTVIEELLLQQYEMAKLDEARDVSSLTRVDRAQVPERRSWPRRTRIVVLSGIMGGVWAILLAYLADAWPGIRRRFRNRAMGA